MYRGWHSVWIQICPQLHKHHAQRPKRLCKELPRHSMRTIYYKMQHYHWGLCWLGKFGSLKPSSALLPSGKPFAWAMDVKGHRTIHRHCLVNFSMKSNRCFSVPEREEWCLSSGLWPTWLRFSRKLMGMLWYAFTSVTVLHRGILWAPVGPWVFHSVFSLVWTPCACWCVRSWSRHPRSKAQSQCRPSSTLRGLAHPCLSRGGRGLAKSRDLHFNLRIFWQQLANSSGRYDRYDLCDLSLKGAKMCTGWVMLSRVG